jgi:hypothetical protein
MTTSPVKQKGRGGCCLWTESRIGGQSFEDVTLEPRRKGSPTRRVAQEFANPGKIEMAKTLRVVEAGKLPSARGNLKIIFI